MKVQLASGQVVTLEVINACRARVRPEGMTEHTFTDRLGVTRTIRARKPPRDIAPSAECVPL
jgi:hypothetical protein